jgi:glycosyltransferase involved in cell wall biosynthesis
MAREYSRALAAINAIDPIDVVEFSNWASEGFVHALSKPQPHVTRVVTMGWQSRELEGGAELGGSKLTNWWRDWTEALPVRRSDAVLTPTHEHARVIAQRLHLRRPPVVSPLGAAPQRQPSAHLPSKYGCYLLYVGKMEPRKGFDTLVGAFSLARPRISGTRLVVVGRDTPLGPGRTSYCQYVLAGVTANVRASMDLLGWVSDDELLGLYRNALAVVVPSRYESFGLPLIEAMQYGKALVATAAGGIPEVVSSHVEGLLVPIDDVPALAESMVLVVNDHVLRHRLETNAAARFEREFTQTAFARRAVEQYADAIRAANRVRKT